MNDILTYIRLCRDTLWEAISSYDLNDTESQPRTGEQKSSDIWERIAEQKARLKALITQKINDLAASPEAHDIITESYGSLQHDIMAHIQSLELQLTEPTEIKPAAPDIRGKFESALDIVDNIIKTSTLDRPDIELLIDRIIVDENGLPEIQLKYALSNVVRFDPAAALNQYEHEIILNALKLIYEGNRDFTSAKFLASNLTKAGFQKTNQSVLPYIAFMIEKEILAPADNRLKPYSIALTKEELALYIQDFHRSMAVGRNAPDGI